jgi:hypothetical protein
LHYYKGKEIEKSFEDIDTRAVVLGHLQRGGSPIAFDRVLATRFGIAAIDLVHEGRFDQMVAIQGNTVLSVPLKDVAGKRKTVDLKLYDIAATFFGYASPSPEGHRVPKRKLKTRFRQVTYTLLYDNLQSSKLVKIRGGSVAI